MVEQWRSINEIAKELEIPETTVRRYFNTFKDFLSGQTFGRVIKYPEQSLPIVDTIYKLYQAGKNTEEIRSELKIKFTQVIEVKAAGPEEQPETLLPELYTQQVFNELVKRNNELTVQNVEALKTIAEVLTRVLDQGEELQKLREEIQQLKEQKAKASFWDKLFKKQA